MRKKMLLCGLLSLVLVVGLNIQHACENYGIEDSPQFMETLLQTNSLGERDKDPSGEGKLWIVSNYPCTMLFKGGPKFEVDFLGTKLRLNDDNEVLVRVNDTETVCQYGGDTQCIPTNCAFLWKNAYPKRVKKNSRFKFEW